MTTQLMNLPVNIPWKLVAASPDMMALRPVGQLESGDVHQYQWKSSLAIYAHEPSLEDLDKTLCDQRITFIKVACSITGYQPPGEEMRAVLESYSDISASDLERAIGSYFACYGVLLNVSVFPDSVNESTKLDELPSRKNYPNIVDFEPKKRDLYQAATEAGEILTASKSGIQTDKSLTTAQTSSTGVNVGAEVPLEGVNAIAGLTQNWGETDKDSRTTMIDSSRERREMAGTTTNLTQMYNLLTGYHTGTNRATFLMLPRLHQLSTRHRTFAQGFRAIEGVQDFMLIVTRPASEEGLCIQATLETGHIVDTPLEEDGGENDYMEEDPPLAITVGPYQIYNIQRFLTTIISNGMKLLGGEGIVEKYNINVQYPGLEQDGWEFDYTKGDPGHAPVKEEILNRENVDAEEGEFAFDNVRAWNADELENYNFYAKPDTLMVEGLLKKMDPFSATSPPHVFHRKYTVYRKRKKTQSETHRGEQENLLITHRNLSVCIKNDDDCLKIVEEDPGGFMPYSIRDEVLIPTGPLTGLQQMQSTLTGGAGRSARGQTGLRSFVDTDYFKDKIRPLLSEETLKRPLARVPDLPENVLKKLGEETTVRELMDMDLPGLARRAGVKIEEAASIRRKLMGLPSPAAIKKHGDQAHDGSEKGSDGMK